MTKICGDCGFLEENPITYECRCVSTNIGVHKSDKCLLEVDKEQLIEDLQGNIEQYKQLE